MSFFKDECSWERSSRCGHLVPEGHKRHLVEEASLKKERGNSVTLQFSLRTVLMRVTGPQEAPLLDRPPGQDRQR